MRVPRPIRHWFIARSAFHRRWIRWRFHRSMRKLERTIGRALLPTMNHATASMHAWLKACETD